MSHREDDLLDPDHLLCRIFGRQMGRKRDRLHPLPQVEHHPQTQLERSQVPQVHQQARVGPVCGESQRRWIRGDSLVRPDCKLTLAQVVGQVG